MDSDQRFVSFGRGEAERTIGASPLFGTLSKCIGSGTILPGGRRREGGCVINRERGDWGRRCWSGGGEVGRCTRGT